MFRSEGSPPHLVQASGGSRKAQALSTVVFGCGVQQHLAYLKRLQKDLKTKQAATEDEQEYSDLMVASKRVDIWIEVLTSLNSFGVTSLDFQSVWDEQFHCSALAPTVPWDFPPWLCQTRLETQQVLGRNFIRGLGQGGGPRCVRFPDAAAR